MTAIVIDDQLLLDTLAGTAHPRVVAEFQSGGVCTTGSWYYRLGRAITGGSGLGALSGRFSALGSADQDQVLGSVYNLPASIAVFSPRVLVPLMIDLRVTRHLNVLAADALATALLTEGTILVGTDAPLIREGADDVGVAYEVLR